jgi:replicative DNA helicase
LATKALDDGEQTAARDEVLRLADHLRSDRMTQLQIHTLGDVAPEVVAMYERVKRGEIGVPFPWQIMTDMTLGMWPGTLTFFVARPGVGKTWTAVITALHAWKVAKVKVLIVSPELGRVELGERLISAHGQFSYRDIVSGTLGDLAEQKLVSLASDLAKGGGDGLFILDDEDKLSPDYIEQAIEATEPALVLIDSLYMLRVEQGKIKSGAGSRGDRMERVVETVNWMRGVSRRKRPFAPTGLPVVGIHQLSREGRPKREAVQALKSGRSTGGLEDTVALSDALFWNAHNLFAMYQDPYMRQDKQLMYVPLKARRQATMSSLVIRWDMDAMDFQEIGTKVTDAEGYKDQEEEAPY